MRPAPKARHLPALAILLVVSAFIGLLGLHDDRLSEDQERSATAALKGIDQASDKQARDIMPSDGVFGQDGPWSRWSPAYRAIVRLLFGAIGHYDARLPFQVMCPFVLLLYLCGMYALLFRQTRSWATSVFVAILSSTVTTTAGGAYWGVGSLASIEPAGICIAVTPLLILLYLQYESRRGVLLVFLLIGLLANVSATCSINLAILLLIVHVARGLNIRSLVTAAIAPIVVAAGAVPAIVHHLVLHPAAGDAQAVSAAAMLRALRLSQLDVLYPEVLLGLLTWLPVAAVLLVAAAAVLWRVERFQARDLEFWASFIMACLFVAFGLQAASQALGRHMKSLPPLGFIQASSLVMLALYVLLAQALTNMFRILHENRSATRWACAVFALFWMLPSDNMRVLRHSCADWATGFVSEKWKPKYVQKHHERRQERYELREIAAWARLQSDPAAVFLVESGEFRMLSRRAILAAREDFIMYYYHAPSLLARWSELYSTQRNALTASAGGDASLQGFINRLASGPGYEHVSEWYVLLRSQEMVPRGLEIIQSAKWGKRYQLCRILPLQEAGADSQSQPAAESRPAKTHEGARNE